MPAAGGRTGPVVLRLGELSLIPTNSNTWESRPCTPQSSTTNLTVLAKVWVNHHPQNHEHGTAIPISQLAAQPYSCRGSNSGWWLDLPQYPPHLWSAGACEGTWPTDPKLQDLHNTGNYRISKKSPINSVETRGLDSTKSMTLCNEHLWVKIHGQKALLCDSLCHSTTSMMRFLIFSFFFS